jgi:inosine-uridine nucleoside N-ribohydrolase
VAERLRAILDVDTGVDDALALALAVRSPQVELLAVTTVAGNVPLPATTENTRRVLAHLDAARVPVHRGFSRPLARPLTIASHVHGETGLGDLELPPSPGETSKPSAPEFLVERITAAPGEITLICTGPLTNLAAAIALEPSLPAALRRLVLMGGSLGRGNVTPYAEFNIYVDPEAAAQVFAACPLTMVGLDVTERTLLTRAAWERLAGVDSPTGRLVHGVAGQGFREKGWEGMELHDPLAVGVALEPTLCTIRRGRLKVETATAWCAGQTTFAEDLEGPHEVCVEVDAPRFLRLFADTLDLPDLA